MSRRDSILVRNVVETCRLTWESSIAGRFGGCPVHFTGCPLFHDCPQGNEAPHSEECVEALIEWLDSEDPGDTLGPGEMKLVEKRTPEGYLDHSDLKEAADNIIALLGADQSETPAGKSQSERELRATLHHYENLLQGLAEAVPLPGSPTHAECVDKAIEIIKEAESLRDELHGILGHGRKR